MSSLAWLDFSESDRQRALDVIDLFRESETVDELGIGTVRDAIADLLFPGTSTIMTRARYYLFIPWIYRRHETKKTRSNEIANKARKDEIVLINALANSEDRKGVIGIEARADLKRLPSTIYWQGLGRLGLRRFPGSRDGYHRTLDAYYKESEHVVLADDGNTVVGSKGGNWDPALPSPPIGFPNTANLQMEYAEAVYLRERIQQSASASLFAFLADSPTTLSDIPFPWQHPLRSRMSEKNNAELEHARNFSETMHGAALLYNLMVAEKKTDDVRIGDYSTMLASWANNMKTRSEELQEWSQPQFWALIDATGARIGLGTSAFINTWIKEAVGPDPYGLAKSKSIRELIRSREQALKGPLARLGNRGVDSWGGASSSDQLDFRWRRPVKAILSDLYLALGHA